jgi:hypothetical protein
VQAPHLATRQSSPGVTTASGSRGVPQPRPESGRFDRRMGQERARAVRCA